MKQKQTIANSIKSLKMVHIKKKKKLKNFKEPYLRELGE